jgi:quinolinate synthase
MKLITLESVVVALKNMEYKVAVSEDIRYKAKNALDKMLKI